MARRRCISTDFYESDIFLNLSDKLKTLYTMLLLHCDDEGAVINPSMVTKLARAQKKHLEELTEKGFLIGIDGIYILKHWYQHNSIQPSKKSPSIYVNTMEKLRVNSRKEYEVDTDKIPEEIRPNLSKVNLSQFNSTQVKQSEVNMKESKESTNSIEADATSQIASLSPEEIKLYFERKKEAPPIA